MQAKTYSFSVSYGLKMRQPVVYEMLQLENISGNNVFYLWSKCHHGFIMMSIENGGKAIGVIRRYSRMGTPAQCASELLVVDDMHLKKIKNYAIANILPGGFGTLMNYLNGGLTSSSMINRYHFKFRGSFSPLAY
jgi:hypothetical protein